MNKTTFSRRDVLKGSTALAAGSAFATPVRAATPPSEAITPALMVSPFGINTDMVKMADAPKSFADLLDPKWKGKMVKAHPAYSGTIMNATFQVARDLGWGYFEKLAKQDVMQVQSATDTPKRIVLGERAIMIDGAGYLVIRDKEAGKPVDVIYPEEGTPLATSPSVVMKAAPNPSAAKLFQNWVHSREGQQILIDYARQYSPHSQAIEKPQFQQNRRRRRENSASISRRRCSTPSPRFCAC
jgi:iron(III) transport system substrate-binding protein